MTSPVEAEPKAKATQTVPRVSQSSSPGPTVASDFIADMFGTSSSSPVWITSLPNVRWDKPGEQHVATRVSEKIEDHLRKWDQPGRALYFCTATVTAEATTRSKATIAELNSLFADIDCKNVLATPKEIERALNGLTLLPSKVVKSGHGYHCYWIFKEAIPLLRSTPEEIRETENNIAGFENLLWLLIDHLGADPHCCDASRLMRLPGSHNTKDGDSIEVKVITDRPLRYEFDDLKEWLETAVPVIRRRPKDAKAPRDHAANKTGSTDGVEYENPFLAYAATLDPPTPFDVEQRLADMRHEGADDTSVHITQRDVTRFLIDRGDPLDEIVNRVLAATRRAVGNVGWNWQSEERNIRDMAVTWGEKREKEFRQESEQKEEQKSPSVPLLHAYAPRPFSEIPRRQWLHAGHYIRRLVVMTVAPGGWGKPSLILCNAIDMCLGIGLLGSAPDSGPLRVAYWNAEDEEEEIERRIAAICMRHKIDPESLRGQLFLGSKITGGRRIAKLGKSGEVIFNLKILTEATQFIGDNHIDCTMFDPLIAFHAVPEADNSAMEQVIKQGFEPIAVATNSCIELSQHTRKPAQGQHGEITADDSRGGGAITNAARSVRVLNRMSKDDAQLPKIADEARRLYLRISRDKANLVPPTKADWVHLASVTLPNETGLHRGDSVQVAEPWDYPQPFDNVTAHDMRWIRDEVRGKAYRVDPRSAEWVGYALARRLKLDIGTVGQRDVNQKGDRLRVNAILKTWFEKGALAKETRPDEKSRKEFEYVIPGPWDEAAQDEETT
jgi:hypothetical protein